jgi:hypothetical protein
MNGKTEGLRVLHSRIGNGHSVAISCAD